MVRIPPTIRRPSLPGVLIVAAAAAGCGSPTPAPDAEVLPEAVIDARCEGDADAPRVLVFWRENLWVHESTPVAAQTFLELCASRRFSVVTSRDPLVFPHELPRTDVVVFAVTSGEVLDDRA